MKDIIRNFEKTSGRKYSERKDGEFRYEFNKKWSITQRLGPLKGKV